MARKRLRHLTYGKDVIEPVCRLIDLHLRFHGYGSSDWTDSAVRRYVTDAGDQLDRLHLLVRSDCTTRNRRRAASLAASYDSLEERIARLAEQEELHGSGRTWMARRSCACSTCRRAGQWVPRLSTCLPCGWSTDRSRVRLPRRRCSPGPLSRTWAQPDFGRLSRVPIGG